MSPDVLDQIGDGVVFVFVVLGVGIPAGAATPLAFLAGIALGSLISFAFVVLVALAKLVRSVFLLVVIRGGSVALFAGAALVRLGLAPLA